jgi:hypothetical protein
MVGPENDAAEFAGAHPGTEAVTQRIGAHSVQVVLVAPSGEWMRSVVTSPEAAGRLCEQLAVACHEGWPDELRRKVTSWRRTPRDWARAPYPERSH